MSSEVRIQICCLVKMFTTHLTGQCVHVLFLHLRYRGLRGGRCWCRIIQTILIIVVLAAARGRCWVYAKAALVVCECFPQLVGDEAMA